MATSVTSGSMARSSTFLRLSAVIVSMFSAARLPDSIQERLSEKPTVHVPKHGRAIARDRHRCQTARTECAAAANTGSAP